MLSIDTISNNKEETLIGLKKRGFKDLKIIDKIIDLNLSRKKTQQELDKILFESNNISRKISEIFKSGNNDDSVSALKEESSDLKLKSKTLSDQLEKIKSDNYGFWNYVSQKVVTNKNSNEDSLLSCKDLDENEYPYSWKSREIYFRCEYIKFGLF